MNSELLDLILGASVSDFEFLTEKLKVHPAFDDVKFGYFIKSVRGVRFPDDLSISFVEGRGSEGQYYYVTDFLDGKKRHETTCVSIEEAKDVLVIRLKSWAVSDGVVSPLKGSVKGK